MPISTQQREIYAYALKHLEAERAKLDNHIAEIHQQLGTKTKTKTSARVVEITEPAPTKTRKKRTMSASARKRIAAAQKLRWKLFHAKGNTDAPAVPVTKKAAGKKRVVSAKTKAKQSAATKKRWAVRKASPNYPVPRFKATKKAVKKTAKKRDNSDIPF